MKFKSFYENFGEVEHKDIDAEYFTEPSLTDTSPSSFEPIHLKVARILRGEIVPGEPVYYDVDEKMSLDDAFDTEDPTQDEMFDLADATEIQLDIENAILKAKQSDGKQEKAVDNKGQADAGSADVVNNSGQPV